MSKKVIIANWKCNPTTLREAQALLAGLKKRIKSKKAEVVVCPPFVYLCQFSQSRGLGRFKLGAQDSFCEREGAFTGQVSPAMLKNLGVKYVILGHSEKRALGESDEIINEKIKAVLKQGLTPVFCIGETAEQRKKGQTFKAIESQLKKGLNKIAKAKMAGLIVAYEPVWAIGTGRACSSNDALTACLFIRKVVSQMSVKASKNIKTIYGGSVSDKNASDYLNSPWLNGLLIGGASLQSKEFSAIVNSV